FMVCMVGITNAMLMSITERFREIATLKCLGATDSFILVQIMIEASIQGAIGGFCGVIIGVLAAVLNSYFQVGSRLFATFDFGGVLLAGLMSLAAGILLAVLASLYPSTRAARMAPMEAMRVE
ncbi:MAG: FtsX-like permease family protein, partial [Victivallaceae bacterium]